MSTSDRLMVAEMAERPPKVAPPLPDIPAANDYPFAGSATSHVDYWRTRALEAENLVDRLLAALRGWRPHT